MMANLSGTDISVNAGDVFREAVTVQLRLTGLRWWMFKARVALAVVKFGFWMMGVKCEVAFKEYPNEQT